MLALCRAVTLHVQGNSATCRTGFSHKRIRNRIGPHGPTVPTAFALRFSRAGASLAAGRFLSDGPGVSTVICVLARSGWLVRA
jgi:hypothetical protein